MVIELFHGLHKADIAFLDKVGKLQTAIDEFFGDRDNQTQIGPHQPFLGLFIHIPARVYLIEELLQPTLVDSRFLKHLPVYLAFQCLRRQHCT